MPGPPFRESCEDDWNPDPIVDWLGAEDPVLCLYNTAPRDWVAACL